MLITFDCFEEFRGGRLADGTLCREPLAKPRCRAVEAAVAAPRRGERLASVFERSKAVRDHILARAAGRCEHFEGPAPFTTSGGQPFLEAHHIRRMTDGGPDDPRFVIALCPNCHRHAHFGADAKDRNLDLSRFRAAPSARLSHLSFESDGAFPSQR